MVWPTPSGPPPRGDGGRPITETSLLPVPLIPTVPRRGVPFLLLFAATIGVTVGALGGSAFIAGLLLFRPEAPPAVASAAMGDMLDPVTYDFASLRLDLLAARHELGITSPFGPRMHPVLHEMSHHSGVDFDLPRGEIISAGAAGVVKRAGWNGAYGRMVELDHGEGIRTRYAHLATLKVQPGDTVQLGDPLGTVGDTGRATGPHLHFEVRVKGRAVDPALDEWRTYFPIRGEDWSDEGVARRLEASAPGAL